MDFDFNEDQVFFHEAVRRFLEEKYPIERHIERFSGHGAFDLGKQIADLGVYSMLVDEAFGGEGMSWVDAALIIEEFGRSLAPVSFMETMVCAELISRVGTEEQKEKYLPRIAAGDLKAVVAASEEQAGYDLSSLSARATKTSNGWKLSGRKILVPEAARADLFLVLALVDMDEVPAVLLVEKEKITETPRPQTTLDPSIGACALDCEGVELLQDAVLGGDDTNPRIAVRLQDYCATVYALHLTGISGKVLDLSVDYASQRVQFGKPIGSFQAIKHKCADMAVLVENARSAAYYAAWTIATDSADRKKAVSMAKSFCSDAARKVCNDGIQVHGGMGFTWELPLHYFLRRAKLMEYAFGDASFHRHRVFEQTLNELGVGNSSCAVQLKSTGT
jgi:alkylation response protein AidB-like acyl-CoA dehydrogenase